ncbi:MAG TPA: hypothetical protein VKA15_02260 [Isosphaeraceae bacterium]|nr:hypothetical protein [Isosphaeraceae bacterium]
MAGMSPGAALRELERANAYLKRSRAALKQAKEDPRVRPLVFQMGWEGLRQAYSVITLIPMESADDAVLSRAIAVQRYATALLVRLRRLKRQDAASDDDGPDDDEWSGDEE